MLETLYCAIIIAIYFLLTFLYKKLLAKSNSSAMSIVKIIIEIVLFIAFLFGIAFVTGFDFSGLQGNFTQFVEDQSSHLIWSIVVIILATTLLGIIKALLFRTKKDNVNIKRQNTLSKILMSLSKYIVSIICIVVILGVWGVDIMPALAGLGIVGLVVGLGAQKLITDFVSGIFIVFEHHFDVGDTIEVGDFKGEVIDIGLKTTKIKNWKGQVKIIANGELTQLINDSNYDTSFDVLIDIAYKEDATKVMKMFDEELQEKLKDREEIISMPKTVGLASLGSSAVTIKIVGSTKAESHYQLTRDILTIIKDLCDKENIEIPYTQVVIHQGK